MQAEAVAEGVEAADGELGAGVLAANAGHAFEALSRVESRSSRHAYP